MNAFRPDTDTLRRYIQRRLNPQEEEELELWLADNPHVVKDLEFDLALQGAIGDIPPQPANEPKPRPARWTAWFANPVLVGATGFVLAAATVTSSVLLIASKQKVVQLQEGLASIKGPVSNPRLVLLDNVRSRSTGSDASIASENAVLIQAVVGFSPGAYEARVIDEGRELFRISNLEVIDDTVLFYLPEGTLSKGEYQIEIEGGEPHREFSYRIQVE